MFVSVFFNVACAILVYVGGFYVRINKNLYIKCNFVQGISFIFLFKNTSFNNFSGQTIFIINFFFNLMIVFLMDYFFG